MKTIPALFLLSCFVSLPDLQANDRDRENPPDPSKFPFEQRLIFHAVLEGLYEDGVSGEALERLIPDPESMWVDDEPEKTNFVYACPICMPTFDALQLYQSRRPFYGQKGTKYNTFGAGLSEEWVSRLTAAPAERRDAVQELVHRWVKRRIDRMKLTDAERASIEENLVRMKKEGESQLQQFQEGGNGNWFAAQYVNWKKCAACEGAATFMNAR